MTWPIEGVEAHLGGLKFLNERISEADAARQAATVAEVVRRLASQPGLILADEVGMGKTYVALGVAAVAALGDKGRRPVVVMVPSSLQQKWPREFQVFKEKCLAPALRSRVTAAVADSALALFRMLDDSPSKRPSVIFLTHGAFHVSNVDIWIRLAMIKRAMHGLHLGEKRTALPRFAASLVRAKSTHRDPVLFERLLSNPYEAWQSIINSFYADRPGLQLGDDPVPEAVRKVLLLPDLELEHLRNVIRDLPARWSDSIEERLGDARAALNEALRVVWPQALAKTRFRSPLLILDEAHHLKNPETRLASLFESKSAEEEADAVCGALSGSFERMLFLTATPFQLGHYELLSVLSRFRGIDWRALPSSSLEEFDKKREGLRGLLDTAQATAAELDHKWRLVSAEDLQGPQGIALDPETWWASVASAPGKQPERIQMVHRAYTATRDAMRAAERELRVWVVRHLRDRRLPNSEVERRNRFSGQALRPGLEATSQGLPVADEALLPFLLAARAQSAVSRASRKTRSTRRATFAEGLASSYEAFLETSKHPQDEVDEAQPASAEGDAFIAGHLKKLAAALPGPEAFARHPKMSALVERVVDLWGKGEKVVVFCHFRHTGRALVRHISVALEKRLWDDTAARLGITKSEAEQAVKRFATRFDQGEPMQRFLEEALNSMMAEFTELTGEEKQAIHDVVRRFVRSPIFAARYFDVTKRASHELLDEAFRTSDQSGISLDQKLQMFLRFIAKRCEPAERTAYLDALKKVHPGLRDEPPEDAEGAGSDVVLMPNIRLANGGVRQESRQRMMLSFNTPFFPEILVASSVLAEGVDLHLNCRYVIHYDLCWNPSTLEQRTGRVDRIGAKAEVVKRPIEVFLPYVGGTQDEKTYRVVLDRERWFQVLMGEKYPEDEATARSLAERVPLPVTAASELAFDLSVTNSS